MEDHVSNMFSARLDNVAGIILLASVGPPVHVQAYRTLSVGVNYVMPRIDVVICRPSILLILPEASFW